MTGLSQALILAEETHIKNLLVLPFALLWLLVPILNTTAQEPLQYFKLSEFTDREPPYAVMMDHNFLQLLDELRRRCGFPIYIKSGYRSENSSDEKHKDKPGTHTKGIAVDIIVNDPQQRATILRHAYELGFTGIGIYPLHIHLDTRETKRVIWIRDSYNVNQARDSPRR